MRIILLAPALALAACDSGPEVNLENATAEEVAAEMKESGLAEDTRQPGKWRYTTTIVEVNAPGMPGGVDEQLKQMMGNGQSMERCVTQEEIDKADSFMANNDSNCTFENYRVGNGKVSGKARCEQDGMTQVMEMDGTYSSGQSEMNMSATMQGSPMGDMQIKMNIKSERLGDCDA